MLGLLAGSDGGASPVTFDAEGSSPPVRQPRLPLPVKLGVRQYEGPEPELHRAVVKALRHDPNFAEVRQVPPDASTRDLDYLVELDFELETNAKGYNFLICFPGFIVFAQHWYRLRWDFDITTRARLLRTREGTEVGRFIRRDDHEMAHTGGGATFATNVGWSEVILGLRPLRPAP